MLNRKMMDDIISMEQKDPWKKLEAKVEELKKLQNLHIRSGKTTPAPASISMLEEQMDLDSNKDNKEDDVTHCLEEQMAVKEYKGQYLNPATYQPSKEDIDETTRNHHKNGENLSKLNALRNYYDLPFRRSVQGRC